MRSEYDNPVFFEEYAKMARSRDGLPAAGEWHQLKPLFPPLAGKQVLDLGCGYGWHCKYVAEQGARRVLGIDLSQRMLDEAQRRNVDPRITYRLCGIEAYEYPAETWDLVVSNLALHYVADLESVFGRVYRTLKPGGTFLFNIEHPTFTAGVAQEWVYADDGRPLYWPVDNYYLPGERRTQFLGCEVVKQHHTLTQILMGVLRQGFTLEAVEEAEPPAEMLDLPGMRDELRRPMMLLVRAGKPALREKAEDMVRSYTWDEYYERYDRWDEDTQLRNLSGLSSLGPADEVSKVIDGLNFQSEYTSNLLLRRAVEEKLVFSGDELSDFVCNNDEELAIAAIRNSAANLTAADMEELYGMIDDEIIVEICKQQSLPLPDALREQIEEESAEEDDFDTDDDIPTPPQRRGLFEMLFGTSSNTGSGSNSSQRSASRRQENDTYSSPRRHNGRCNGDCAHCPPHYGYRYGRWYYGHDHVHGCEFGGNRGSGSMD